MKIIFNSSIILLLFHNLHGMKRDYLTDANKKKSSVEIYEDLEDGINPDSENSAPYFNSAGSSNQDDTKSFLILNNTTIKQDPSVEVASIPQKENDDKDPKYLQESRIEESPSLEIKINNEHRGEEAITFTGGYFNRLFGLERSIDNIYHGLSPRLILFLLQQCKIMSPDDSRKVTRGICGVLCTRSEDNFHSMYTIKYARILTNKNNEVWHIGFEPPREKFITRKVSYLYKYILNNKQCIDNMLELFSKNISSSSGILEKKMVIKKDYAFNDDQYVDTKTVNILNYLGGFPNKIINKNEKVIHWVYQ